MPSFPTDSLERQLVSILGRNREDSFQTQRKRFYELRAASQSLKGRFGLQKWDNLKEKHVRHLVELWKAQDRGCRTIEQKLTHLRWLVGKLGKPNLLPRSNADLGISPGPRHTRAGRVVSEEKFKAVMAVVQDPRILAMLTLAREFGLRFEEAALFRPWKDGEGDRVWVKRGTKGGRPRYLFLHNEKQAAALREARAAVDSRDGGIIPREVPTFEKWRQHVYRILRAAGLSHEAGSTFHDIRRTYLVERMQSLVRDRATSPLQAARLVAREAGHHRTEILDWYVAESSPEGVVAV